MNWQPKPEQRCWFVYNGEPREISFTYYDCTYKKYLEDNNLFATIEEAEQAAVQRKLSNKPNTVDFIKQQKEKIAYIKTHVNEGDIVWIFSNEEGALEYFHKKDGWTLEVVSWKNK